MSRKECKRPNRWFRQRTLKGDMKGHCQMMGERKNPAITLDWVKRACHNVRIQSPKSLLEKLMKQGDVFVEKLRKGPDALMEKDPRFQHKVTTEYAMSDAEFESYSDIHQDVAKCHQMFETYLQLLIRRYAVVSKRNCKKKLVVNFLDEKLDKLLTLN